MRYLRHRPTSLLLLLLVACGTDAPAASSGTHQAAAGPTWVAKLDATRGELPEGLALDADGTTAYVGLAPSGKILAVDTELGTVEPFGSVPTPPANEGYLLGLAVSQSGDLFAGVASSTPSYQAGIYRLPPNGGEAVLFATHPELRFPNGLAFDDQGALFVTDSLSGSIFRVDAQGQLDSWASDPRFVGAVDGPCANGAGFPIGANGIVIDAATAYVVNSDQGSLLRIAIRPDGGAGEISTVVATDCAALGGADGLAMDGAGALIVAANAIDAITRVSKSGEATVIFAGGAFDFPASLALHATASGEQVFVTNAALKSAQTAGATPHPGLVKLELARAGIAIPPK
jgi:sugar lactone lactonase YvrE